MRVNLPSKLRFAIYVFNGLVSILVIYLQTKGLIATPEIVAWGSFTTFTNTMAALNVSEPK